MKITGYQIRESLKEWRLKKDLAQEAFNDSLFAFKDEIEQAHIHPKKHMDDYIKAEKAIVLLQEAQITYNMKTKLNFGNEEITLAHGIKLIGGIGRAAKLWRNARSQKASKNYLGRGKSLIREKDEEYAQKVMPDEKINEKLTEKIREENQLRAAIATANAREMDIDLDASLLFRQG